MAPGPLRGRQLQAATRVPELLAIGVPDLRLTGLAGRFDQLLDRLESAVRTGGPRDLVESLPRLRAAVPWVRSVAEGLAGLGILETLQHDDLNDGAVYLAADGPRILD